MGKLYWFLIFIFRIIGFEESLNKYFNYFTAKKAGASLLLCFLITIKLAAAQGRPAPEYQVKAAFIYNFTRFISWPDDAFSSPDAPFVIGILGSNPFGTYLSDIVKGEAVGKHPIVIQHFRSIKDIGSCHILFVSSKEGAVLSTARRYGVLTIGDSGSPPKWNGVIRFFKEENKIRLQINTASAKDANLTISSKLLNVARVF